MRPCPEPHAAKTTLIDELMAVIVFFTSTGDFAANDQMLHAVFCVIARAMLFLNGSHAVLN